MAKNLSIVAQGISGDEGHLLGYNVSDNGIYTPAIGDVVRGTTATYVAQDGLLKTAPPNVARVDYTNGVAELLLEPSSTNLVTYSNSNNLNFILDGVSLTYNSVQSPDGEQNGITFEQVGSFESDSAYNYGSLPFSDGKYSYSFFIKAKDSTKFRILSDIGSAITQDFNPFDMQEGILQGSLNLKFESVSNGWFRVSFTRDLSSAPYNRFQIYPDRNVNQQGVYIYGIQVEQQSIPTAYIPTNGATATRSSDSLTNFGSSQIIDSVSGMLFFEGIPSYGVVGLLNESDGSNSVFFQKDGTTISGLVNNVRSLYFSGFSEGDVLKIVIKYNGTQYSLYVNGGLVDTKSITSMSNMNTLNFVYFLTSYSFYGRVRQVKHLPYNTDISKL